MDDPLAARAREIRVRHLPLDEFPVWEAAQRLEADMVAALRETAADELLAIESHIRRPDFRQIHDIPDGDDIDSIARLLHNRASAIREGKR